MGNSKIHQSRIQPLNEEQPQKDSSYILYWMQQSQRAEWNPTLEYAIQRANELQLPLVVGFGLMDDYPEAHARHYHFMLEGLTEVQRALRKRGVLMVVRRGHPTEVALELAKDAAVVVCDRGYLRHQKEWRHRVAQQAKRQVIQVEGDVVVPVEVVSDKAEYAARTIRPKIHRHLNDYLEEFPTSRLKRKSLELKLPSFEIDDVDEAIRKLKLDSNVTPVQQHRGGTSQAKKRLQKFFRQHFSGYDSQRSRPESGYVSYMGMYLHFGQISSVYVALQARQAEGIPNADRESFLEELIVRRELAMNFVHFTPNYDSYECLPEWARATLAKHAKDKRDPVYSATDLERSRTQDDYWNASMTSMRLTGYLHNALRMYWAKKILEWSQTPEEAFRTTLTLNNKYFLDGRDANSYTNVAWAFGLHDRPWKERAIFGTVRYMAASGLERKCDIDEFVSQVARLEGGDV